MKLSRHPMTCQTSGKFFWPPGNQETLNWNSTIQSHLLHMRLLFSISDWSILKDHIKTFLQNTSLSHMRLVCPQMILLCPTWDCPVSHEIAMSHIKLLFPIWDWYVPDETGLLYEIALCHMRFLCPTLDCSSPYETGLSQMRLVCPTWDWSVPNETALSNVFCKAQRFLSSFFTFLGLIWHFRDWSMGRDWDRTRS